MQQVLVDRILGMHKRGANIVMRRKTTGGGRIKVQGALFGLLPQRFDVDVETYQVIKDAIREE